MINITDKAKEHLHTLLDSDPDLRLREELVGYHSINPFIKNTSASRGYMMSSHSSQRLTLVGGDEKIIQTGLEKQFGKNTLSTKAENDYNLIKVVNRYNGISNKYASVTTEKTLIVEDAETGELDYIEMPYKYTAQGSMGFRYKWNKNALDEAIATGYIKKGTIFADSPAVTKNSGYKHGVNANMALITLPETDKDGVIISESLAKRLAFEVFETRVIEFGANAFPLNLYGTKDEYKPFPDIGEKIADHSVLMAVREYDDHISPAITSVNDMMEFDPLFDICTYVRGPGEDIDIGNGKIVGSGVVVDIKAYYNPKHKKECYTGVTGVVDKYVNGLKKYYQEIIDVYERAKSEHYAKYKENIKVSEKLHKLLIDAYAVANPNNDKINYVSRKDNLDIYRIEITVKYTIVPDAPGYKTSDSGYGAKGVIVDIWPDSKMPYTQDGVRADAIMDPMSIVSRMNIGRYFDMYISGTAVEAKKHIENILNIKDVFTLPDSKIEEAWKVVINYLSIIDTEQYQVYSKLTNKADKLEILDEIVNDNFYIYYKINSKKSPLQLVSELSNSNFAIRKDHIWVDKDGEKVLTKEKILIAPIYMIELNKTADNYLAVSSAKVNHYGLPINVGSTGRNRLPNKESPTKNMSETDVRIYAAYGGRLAISELKDRANSIETHSAIYRNVLLADKPTNIDEVVDRNIIPFGTDKTLKLIDLILNAGGIEIEYDAKDGN